MSKKISLAFADDHIMMRKGLIRLLQMMGNYNVLFDVDNGDEVIKTLKNHVIPDIIILDVNMGNMDGSIVTEWISINYPQIKLLILTMYTDENTILKMIQAGAKGYIAKNSDPEKLHEAIQELYNKGSYIPDAISRKIINGIRNNVLSENINIKLTSNERKFLSLLCRQLSYSEIAEKMYLSPNTMDDYRKKLTKKLKVKGKSGLIIYAMQHGYNKDNSEQ